MAALVLTLMVSSEGLGSDRADSGTNVRTFSAEGVVKELKRDGKTVIITHKTITNFMDAMTMPFKAKESKDLAGLRAGDQISFRLSVTEDESWIDAVRVTGKDANRVETLRAPATAQETLPGNALPASAVELPIHQRVGAVCPPERFSGTGIGTHVFLHTLPDTRLLPAVIQEF